jgi:hypothetical protein
MLLLPFWLSIELTDEYIIAQMIEYQYFQKSEKLNEKVKIYLDSLINFINCEILISEMN